jgi:hypothetical protein
MMVVCKDRLDKIQARERLGVEAAAAVEADIANLLSGKSYEHLVALQKQIQAKLASREPLDVEYWEGLLKKLLVYKAQVGVPSNNPDRLLKCQLQSKLKTQHEVVVQNRLEQLRKRQRDEALHAQEELLAGVVRSISKNVGVPFVSEAQEQLDSEEVVEPYDRSMSPQPIDITKLPYDERQMDIVTGPEDKKALVRLVLLIYHVSVSHLLIINSMNVVARLCRSALSRSQSRWSKAIHKTLKPPAGLILPRKPYTEQKQKKIWMKKKKCSIWKKTSPILLLTLGKINIDLENRDTSIGYILVTNGTNITKLITSTLSIEVYF